MFSHLVGAYSGGEQQPKEAAPAAEAPCDDACAHDGHGHSHSHGHSHDHGHGHGHGSTGRVVVAQGDADGRLLVHSHDGLAPHTHEVLTSPGEFLTRAQPLARDYRGRRCVVSAGVDRKHTALTPALSLLPASRWALAALWAQARRR